eukprot:scaffold2149_cov187-Cylindrotheca_fusiformis.AAC.16
MKPSGGGKPSERALELGVPHSESSQERTHLLRKSDGSVNTTRHSVSVEGELGRSRRLLYLSHLLNQFSENAWQFCLVLFLAAFSNYDSLILVCTYGLCSGFVVCTFGARIGRFIDDTDRLFVARLFIGLENFAVLAATACCYTLLSGNRKISSEHELDDHFVTRMSGVPTDAESIVLLIGIHFLGALARVLDAGFVVAIERDWIVVMSECITSHELTSSQNTERQKKWLSETNVAMKQIDLSSKIVAPAVAGFIVAFLDDGTDPHHGSDLRGAALFVGCLNAVALIVEYTCTSKIFYQIQTLGTKPTRRTFPNSEETDAKCRPISLPEGLKVYKNQSVSWAGIGLSLLHNDCVLGLERDVIRSDWNLAWSLVCRWPCGDFCLMQLNIPVGIRGLVGGVQESLNSLFFLLSFALGILIPDPQYFHIYVGVGYVSVALAVLCFAFGIFPNRHQLGPVTEQT